MALSAEAEILVSVTTFRLPNPQEFPELLLGIVKQLLHFSPEAAVFLSWAEGFLHVHYLLLNIYIERDLHEYTEQLSGINWKLVELKKKNQKNHNRCNLLSTSSNTKQANNHILL